MDSESPQQNSPTQADSAPRHLVCVIDDDSRLRKAICDILHQAGFATADGSDGEIGMKLVQELNPAVVVTDIVMPNREGLETIRALKAAFPEIPVLAISGSGGPDKDYLEWAQTMGADDCLSKPFGSTDLVQKVLGLVSRPL